MFNYNQKRISTMEASTNTTPMDPVTIPVAVTIANATANIASNTQSAPQTTISAPSVPNLITVPVPIVHNEENYVYVMIKGSLHDRSCSVFGLNDEERQAVAKRFENVKIVVNGVMAPVSPVDMVNTLAQLNYKVICSSGEAEICWTMQREI